jgi:nucleotidyltransferase substrate binding protein (TIGR01987 family)
MALELSSYEKAITSLDMALKAYAAASQPEGSTERELMRDGVIQRFEYTFELAWKLVKRYLEEYGLERVDSLTNRDLFRVGFEQGLLRDAEAWLNYLKSRNLTSHTYEPATAKIVFQSAQAFLGDARFLLDQLHTRAQ